MAIFVSDLFNETTNKALESHVGEIGATWTFHTSYSTSYLQVNAANDNLENNSGVSTGSVLYYASGSPPSAEYGVEVDLSRVSANGLNLFPGISGRIDTAADTHYMARYSHSAGDWQLYKASSGSYTLLGSYTQSLSDTTYAQKLEILDATKKVYIDSVERISSSDNSITAAGKAGVRWNITAQNHTGFTQDNFVATDAAVGGATTIDLTAAALGFTAQDTQPSLSTALTTASLSFSSLAVQGSLIVGLAASALSFTTQAPQISTLVALTTAALSFTALAITTVIDTIINLTVATLSFTARAITVTGAIVVDVSNFVLQKVLRPVLRKVLRKV
jgi:hypothetical protein